MLHCDILIKNARILRPNMTVATDQTIVISNSEIVKISDSVSTSEYEADTIIDNPDLLWMPGLTDGHLHTSQQFLKGSLLDEKPVIWKRINVPFEASLLRKPWLSQPDWQEQR